MQANTIVSPNGSLKQSVIKQLNKEMLAAVTTTVHNTIFRNIRTHLPPDIHACFFGSPNTATPTVSATTTTAAGDNKQDHKNDSKNKSKKKLHNQIYEEWNNICNSAHIPAVDVDVDVEGSVVNLSLPELTTLEESGPPTGTDTETGTGTGVVLPPLVSASSSSSRSSIFSSVKNLFSNNKKATNSSSSSNSLATDDKKKHVEGK